MRDAKRLKEKVEVNLDNRQIFFLFFGSAVVACLVFIIGVMVGKKLESRKHKRERRKPTSLALIDKNEREAGAKLTFHERLLQPDAQSKRDVPPEVAEWRAMDGKEAHKAVANATSPAARPAPQVGKQASPSENELAKATHPVIQRQRGKQRRYTLQVSAFKKKTEADDMLKKLRKRGFRPYVVASHIKNRGVWYRVRLGTYRSWGKALKAKEKFERRVNMTAYVSRR